jgi:YbbR domain-containing protein
MRSRSDTIGPLGRSPARQSQQPPSTPPAPPSRLPPPMPEGGAIRRWLRGALFENTGLKFLSLVLGVTVFLLVNTDKDREVTVRVGVRYEYPADKVLVSEVLDEVRVTIRGPWRRLRQFDERELGRITLDLRTAPTGDVAITPDMVTNLPPSLIVTAISPRSVHVAFDKRVEKLVEVAPQVGGRPQHGYVVAEVKAAPATTRVRGAERLLAALSLLRTSEVSLEGRTDSFEELAELAAPDGVAIDPGQQIVVQVRIVEELVIRKVPDVAVTATGPGIDPARWQVTPAQVDVTLTGALLAVEKARTMLAPIVRVAPGEARDREVLVHVEGLPAGVGVKVSPERVKVAPAQAVR